MRLFEDGITLEKYQSVIYESERERLASDTSEYEDGYDIEYSDCDYSLFPLVGPEDATPKGIVALIMLFVGDNIIKGGNIHCGYDGRKYLVMANGYAIDMREPELEFDRLADWITGYSCEETGSAGAYDLGKEYRGEEQATRDIEFFVALDDIDLDELRKEWRLANPESFAMQIDGITSYLRFGINELKSYNDKASSTI